MTWAEFNAMVRGFMPEHNRRFGLQGMIDQLIRAGCSDLQSAIGPFCTGHTTELEETDFVVDGHASVGSLPSGVLTMVRLVAHDPDTGVTDYENFVRPREHSWKARAELVRGVVAPTEAYMAVNPTAGLFMIAPAVDEKSRLVLEWTGIRTDWKPNDPVKFNEVAAQAVSEYVLARLTRNTEKDMQRAASHEQTFIQLKRRLRSQEHARGFVPEPDA